ncbi:MAG: hypothetical protein CM15mP49_35030 [Actinomycetota bacterium]|nr:MAG: hypothetical protein CM15mP49_35030 [Actinomycetota bacterium]
MLDHVTNNRFEFGTGRGAGSHELMTFSGTQPSQTKLCGMKSFAKSQECGNKRLLI